MSSDSISTHPLIIKGRPRRKTGPMLLLLLGLAPALAARAADLMIYEDSLASGWQNWSWSANLSADTANKASGASSLAVAYTSGWAGLSFANDTPVATAGYSSIRFSVYGKPGGGALSLYTQPTGTGANSASFQFTPAANAWKVVDVPMSALGNPAQIGRLTLMDWTGAVQPAYNIDSLRLVEKVLPPVSLAIDATAARKAISPLIYGVNGYAMTGGDAAYIKSLGVAARRWGGNNVTRYNWQIDAGNTANDWFFENVRMSDAANLPADSGANRFIAQNRLSGADTLLTVPMIGYVAKNGDLSTCGFSVAKYGAQQSADQWRPDCGNGVKPDGKTLVTGNNPLDTSVAVGPSFVQSWVAYLVKRYGKAGSGGVRYYNLDNEMDIWWGTHRDVSPVGKKYDQIRDLTYQYAAAVKAADPAAQTLGPVMDGWTYYWHSPYDGQRQDWATPDDRNAHGGTPMVPWYLQQMKAYETAHGKRILDFLDLHYYTASPNVSLSDAVDAATQALRLRSTRSLWDPSYVDESWIAQAGPDGGIVKLIPRMRDWVNTYYPGTKLAVTEYNWGAPGHINGALAQADVLGIFGREGLDLATLWSPPQAAQPAAFAFRIYRNYDGAGAKFGETSVGATSSAQDRLAVYAAEEAATGALTLVVINKTAAALSAPTTLSHYQPTGVLQGWRYSAAQLGSIAHLANQSFTGAQFSASYPANSITLWRLAGKRL